MMCNICQKRCWKSQSGFSSTHILSCSRLSCFFVVANIFVKYFICLVFCLCWSFLFFQVPKFLDCSRHASALTLLLPLEVDSLLLIYRHRTCFRYFQAPKIFYSLARWRIHFYNNQVLCSFGFNICFESQLTNIATGKY